MTIGVFDGVHRGHRRLLDRTVARAAADGPAVAVTFDPHPLAVLRPDLAPLLLTSVEQRLELFASVGLDAVLVLEFTAELAAESAERFTSRVLAATLNARHVVVGRNFRFGHRATGDAALLVELGRELGFDVTVVDLEPLGDSDPATGGPAESVAVSSTAIRSMIAAGDVAAAAPAGWAGSTGCPGRSSRATGVAGSWASRPPTSRCPRPWPCRATASTRDGSGWTARPDAGERWLRAGHWRPAAISVGTNPTFDGDARRVEAFVIDAPDGYDVYGQWADVEFVERIRPMLRFDSVGTWSSGWPTTSPRAVLAGRLIGALGVRALGAPGLMAFTTAGTLRYAGATPYWPGLHPPWRTPPRRVPPFRPGATEPPRMPGPSQGRALRDVTATEWVTRSVVVTASAGGGG